MKAPGRDRSSVLIGAWMVAVAGGLALSAHSPCAAAGAAWQLLDDGTPDRTIGTGLAHDPVRGTTVLVRPTGQGEVLTWEWNGAWTRRFPPGALPTGLAQGAVVYDGAGSRVVLFGGASGNETWEYDGTVWTRRLTATSPPVRRRTALAYDSTRQRVVLFGGVSLDPTPQLLGDTWEYDGTDWIEVQPATAPAARASASMTFDAAREVVVLFGGAAVGAFSDTWEYDGFQWTRRKPTTSPPARERHVCVYDPLRQVTVLFGGYVVGGTDEVTGDTWEWDGRRWTERSPAVSPSPRHSSSATWDARISRVVLYGGETRNDPHGDLWSWDGTSWALLPMDPVPEPREEHALAWDPRRAGAVLYGGRRQAWQTYQLHDTWEWNGAWLSRPDVGAASASLSFPLTFDTTWGELVGWGGSPPFQPIGAADLHRLQGTPEVWSSEATSSVPRHGQAAADAPSLGGVLVFGGQAARSGGFSETDETHLLVSGVPIDVSVSLRPSRRYDTALAFDTLRGIGVLYGGGGYECPGDCQDTWLFEGTAWSPTPEAGSGPGRRAGHTLLYVPALDRTVLFGGYRVEAAEQVTWEFDGATWSARPTAFRPEPDRANAAVTYDAQHGVMLLFGGRRPGDVYYNDLWAYGPDLDDDGIVGGLDNCVAVSNSGQGNVDGDAAGDACDCAPSDPGSFATPVEVNGLRLDGASPTTVSWADQAQTIGSSATYDLVSGGLGDLRTTGGFAGASCLANDLSTPDSSDSRTPSTGDGFYYLVRAENACGVGTYGPPGVDAASPCP